MSNKLESRLRSFLLVYIYPIKYLNEKETTNEENRNHMLVLKKIYELRSEALLTQIFVKLSTTFCLQWIYLRRH